MDNIHADDEGYAQTALLDGYILQGAYLVDTLQVEHTAQLAFGNQPSHLSVLSRTGDDVASHLQIELPYLLLESHASHQLVDKLLHRLDVLSLHSYRCQGCCQ